METVAPLFVVALLLLAGVLAGKVSGRFGIPALLLFLVIGMLAGSDGPGGIEFVNAELTTQVGSVALAFILFSGGLDTRWNLVRPVLWPGLSLATIGIIVTATIAGIAASVIFDFPILIGLLVGVIVSPTDAAAVFSVLRARSIGLRRGLRPLLEFESASNDPMAVILTIGITELIASPEVSTASLALLVVRQFALGAALGLLLAHGAIWLTNKLRLEYEGLYPVLTVAVVLLIFSATTAVEGSGFLAVYLAGLTMARPSRSQAVDRTVPRRHWLADADRDVLDAWPPGLSVGAAHSGPAGVRSGAGAHVRSPTPGGPDFIDGIPLHLERPDPLGLGGIARGGARRPCYVSVGGGGGRRRHDLPGRLLRRIPVGGRAGDDHFDLGRLAEAGQEHVRVRPTGAHHRGGIAPLVGGHRSAGGLMGGWKEDCRARFAFGRLGHTDHARRSLFSAAGTNRSPLRRSPQDPRLPCRSGADQREPETCAAGAEALTQQKTRVAELVPGIAKIDGAAVHRFHQFATRHRLN